MSEMGQRLSNERPGQNSNLATAYPAAADLLRRLRPIHAQCQEGTNAPSKHYLYSSPRRRAQHARLDLGLFQSFKCDGDDRLFAISRIDVWRGVDSQLLTVKFEVPDLVRASPGFVPRCHNSMDDFATVNAVSPSVSTKNSVVERSTFRICYHWTSGRLALAPD